MSDHEQHHAMRHGANASGHPSRAADAPMEPGHPEHPETAHAGGHPPTEGMHDHGAHDRHAGHSVEMFRRKFWGTLALTVPTLAWSPMLQRWLGYTAPPFPGSRFIPAIFGTLVFAYGGWVFLQGARRELADRRPGMMTLISLAITVAFVFSVAVTLGFPGMPLWEELSTLVTIMVLGHWIEMRSVTQAQ
ncbi:MAG TPA: heavy metal translocating P-type ATPase, partial [Gemmatimonadaceae bacterium]